MCLIQPGPGKSRSVVTESLASSLYVWEALPWLLGQPLTSLPTRRVPPKGPRSPGTPFAGMGSFPRLLLAPPARILPQGQAGVCGTPISGYH